MKTPGKPLLIMAFMSLLFNCQKSDPFGDELSDDTLKSAHNGVIILVEPTGTDDTEHILKAFADAEAAGPGTTIQLVEGDYYTGAVEVYGFHGTVKGAGNSKTIMHLIPGIPVDEQINKNQSSAWWRLIGGDITLSDMTFTTPDGIIVKEGFVDAYYGKDLYAAIIFTNYNDVWYHPDEFQKVRVNRVNFYGGYDDPEDGGLWKTNHNTLLGIWIGLEYCWPAEGIDYPLTQGNYMIENCYFEHFGDAVEGFSLGGNAKMVVQKCSLNKCMWPLFFTANYNSDIVIRNNLFTNTDLVCDIGVWDHDYGYLFNTEIPAVKRCRYTITGNTFHTTAALPAIVAKDYWVYLGPDERLPMQLIIENNKFCLSEGSSGILLNNSQNAVVRNNRFSGSCTTGIVVDGFNEDNPEAVPYAWKALLLGNNFSRLTSSVANIYLGEKSKNCVVVGSKTDGKVIDKGVDNKITGMTKGKPGLRPGPTIRDNFRLVRDKPLPHKYIRKP
jgi:hypothetical protein